jgi:hypothetical protein
MTGGKLDSLTQGMRLRLSSIARQTGPESPSPLSDARTPIISDNESLLMIIYAQDSWARSIGRYYRCDVAGFPAKDGLGPCHPHREAPLMG